MRTFVVGDVHGHYQELRSLLRLIEFAPADDRLLLLGDVVNRGPDSYRTLAFLYAHRQALDIVLGNHDLMTLAGYYRAVGHNKATQQILTHAEGARLLEWLATQPFIKVLETRSDHTGAEQHWIATHAGIPPCWSLATLKTQAQQARLMLKGNARVFCETMLRGRGVSWQAAQASPEQQMQYTVNSLTRMRLCRADGTLAIAADDEDSGDYAPWYQWPGKIWDDNADTRLLFGHWAALGGETHSTRALCLEAGVSWGGSLRCLCLETGEYAEVPSTVGAHR